VDCRNPRGNSWVGTQSRSIGKSKNHFLKDAKRGQALSFDRLPESHLTRWAVWGDLKSLDRLAGSTESRRQNSARSGEMSEEGRRLDAVRVRRGNQVSQPLPIRPNGRDRKVRRLIGPIKFCQIFTCSRARGLMPAEVRASAQLRRPVCYVSRESIRRLQSMRWPLLSNSGSTPKDFLIHSAHGTRFGR